MICITVLFSSNTGNDFQDFMAFYNSKYKILNLYLSTVHMKHDGSSSKVTTRVITANIMAKLTEEQDGRAGGGYLILQEILHPCLHLQQY